MARTRLPSRKQDGHCPTEGASWLTAAGRGFGGLAEHPALFARLLAKVRPATALVIVVHKAGESLYRLPDCQVFRG